MKATEVLKHEHEAIQSVLRCLTAAVDQAERGGQLEAESIGQMLEFFREFADHCHHTKEEKYFFPLLDKLGVGCDPAPITSLFADHQKGRDHVQALKQDLTPAAQGEGPARERFIQHARQYLTLMAEHIGKEDHCLLPSADERLTAADHQTLVQAFDDVERQEMGAGTHERLHSLAGKLCEQWGVPFMGPQSESAGPSISCDTSSR